MRKPLDGVLVVALEQAVAAPLATSRLADAGARVIKLERPEGDFARGYDDHAAGHSSYFVWLNRGKESCRVDLRQADDLAMVRAMLAKADVFVQNLGPGAAERLGLGAAALRADFPRLITCDICGFAPDTPDANRKAYDLTIQAEAGLSEITGSEESGPSRIGISICDITTGMTAHAQILEALYARERTGVGAAISVSLFDVAVEAMSVPYVAARNGGPVAKRVGLQHPSIAPYGAYEAQDGRLLVAVQNDREWVSFTEKVLGQPALGTDPRFAGNRERVRNRPELEAIIGAAIAGMTTAEALARVDAARIAFARVSTLPDLVRHAGVHGATCVQEGTEVQLPAHPAVIDGVRRGGGEVPALGAQDADLRAEFAPAMRRAPVPG